MEVNLITAAPSTGHDTLFGLGLWCLWQTRNKQVFQGIQISPVNVAQHVCMVLVEVISLDQRFPHMTRPYADAMIGWSCPQNNRIKCNLDGSFLRDTGSSTCGGVFSDTIGKWLGGFSRNLGSCSILMEEI